MCSGRITGNTEVSRLSDGLPLASFSWEPLYVVGRGYVGAAAHIRTAPVPLEIVWVYIGSETPASSRRILNDVIAEDLAPRHRLENSQKTP
jgi:hypothetical protein